MIAKNVIGESLPILTPNTLGVKIVDGTNAHAESTPFDEGKYRIAVQTTVGDVGCHIAITSTGDGATVTTGLFMGNGCVEYFLLATGSIVSVINGKINICPAF